MEFSYNDLKAALNLINSYFTDLPKDYMKLAEENAALEKEKAELKNKVKILVDQNDQLTKDITARTTRNKALEDIAAHYRKTIEELNAKIAARNKALEADAARYRKTVEELNAKIADLSKSNTKSNKSNVTVKVDEYDLDKAINDILSELPDNDWFKTFARVFGDAFKGDK